MHAGHIWLWHPKTFASMQAERMPTALTHLPILYIRKDCMTFGGNLSCPSE